MPSGNPLETDSTQRSPVHFRHPGRAASAAAAGALAPPAAAGYEAEEPRGGVAAGLTLMAEGVTVLPASHPASVPFLFILLHSFPMFGVQSSSVYV